MGACFTFNLQSIDLKLKYLLHVGLQPGTSYKINLYTLNGNARSEPFTIAATTGNPSVLKTGLCFYVTLKNCYLLYIFTWWIFFRSCLLSNVFFIFLAKPVISPPANIRFTSLTPSTISFSWEPPQSIITGYYITHEEVDGIPRELVPRPLADRTSATISGICLMYIFC